MKLVAAKCPNCGANIDVDKDSDTTKCEFCHSKIIVEDAIAKVKVEVEIKNIPKYESYVTLGDRYYDEFRFKEARTEYKKALEFDPNNIKLVFREKICRACTMSFDRTDENIIDDAFSEIREQVEDKAELSQYVKESSNALAYIINKAVEHYQQNNLDFSDVISVHSRISMCAIDIWYLKSYVDDDSKEIKLMLLDQYISACHLLTQDMSYKIPRSRNKGIYKVSYKEKKNYVENMKKAEAERNELLENDSSLKSKSNLHIPKTNYFKQEYAYIYFIILLIANIIIGIVFANLLSYFAIGICIGNFIYLAKRSKYVKKNKPFAIKTNIIGTIICVIAIAVGVSTMDLTPKFAKTWKNDNMIIKINKKDAALKFNNSDTIISGKFKSSCDDKNNCTITFGTYTFYYTDNRLCLMENEQCTQHLFFTDENVSLPVASKTDMCPKDEKVTCSEKGYFVCSGGTEHPENVCNYEDEKKENERNELIVSIIMAVCLVGFVGWATNWRKY